MSKRPKPTSAVAPPPYHKGPGIDFAICCDRQQAADSKMLSGVRRCAYRTKGGLIVLSDCQRGCPTRRYCISHDDLDEKM